VLKPVRHRNQYRHLLRSTGVAFDFSVSLVGLPETSQSDRSLQVPPNSTNSLPSPDLARNNAAVRTKPYLRVRADTLKPTPDIKPSIKQRGAIMWKLLSVLYREYCRARLAEIRKYNLAKTA
jgi:hypothetical protein